MLSISYRVDWSAKPADYIRSYAIYSDKMEALRKCIALYNAGYSVHLWRCIYDHSTCTPTTYILWQSKTRG
jgi:hypothetical protein